MAAQGPSDEELRAIEAQEARERRLEQLGKARRMAVGMALRDQIDMRAYRRLSVKLAWSYAQHGGDLDALTILSELTEAYLNEEMSVDAAGDADLLASAEGLAGWLTDRGHVGAGAGDVPTMHVMAVGRA